ncbi:MAG: exodeoxyribonuclease VII small subunit [Bdellovibrionota bacterium]|jgi:exodeoxyribonuclease VII small subunit
MAKEKKQVELEDLLKSDEPAKLIEGLKFENGMQLLEQLVGQVEGGGLDLERSMVSYERGLIVLEHLREVLSRAEQKLQVVQGD